MPAEYWQQVRKLLVIYMGNIDTIINIGPALRTLQHNLPGVTLSLLTSPAGSQMAPLLPWVNQVLVTSTDWSQALSPNGSGQVELIDSLRAGQFEAAVILTGAGQSPYPAAYTCYLAGIPIRLGQSQEFGGKVLSQQVKGPAKPGTPVDRHLHLLQAAGFEIAGRDLELRIPEAVEPTANTFLYEAGLSPEAPFIALAFGVNDKLPRPDSTRLTVIKWLYRMEKKLPFILLGGEEVSSLVPVLQRLNPNGSLTSLAGKTSVVEFAALISRARLVIASHILPVQIAEAFRRPRMSLYGAENRSRDLLMPALARPAA